VLRVLRRPRWIAYLLLAVLFGVITTGLGLWQFGRYEEKAERRDLIEANYGAAPVPLEEVLPDADTALPPGDQWRRVSVTGTYDSGSEHLVRNRPQQGVFGYEVLVPLVLADGSAVAVDRGWVRSAATAATRPEVPPPPEGEVRVTGWLRPSEPDLGRDLPPGQLASIDLPGLEEATGLELVQAYVILESEDPPAQRPSALAAPDTRLGSHFAYALQWWMTVPVGLVLVLVMARQQSREESGLPVREPRPRKVRIWDEEDE
jgi:cytochrome oxidase assembly protein ShyY1